MAPTGRKWHTSAAMRDMTSTFALAASPRSRLSAIVRNGWMLAVVLAAALFERAVMDFVGDVSWLVTLCEKILAGQTPYVDFLETNPPASIYLYLPPVVLAKLLGLKAEFAVGVFVYAAVGLSLWASACIVWNSDLLRGVDLWRVTALFAALLLVLPAQVFAQREHLALIAFLPVLTVSLVRAEGKQVELHWALLAGICGGVVAIIKPHLAAAIAVTALAASVYARSFRPLLAVENFIAAAMLAAYAAIVIQFFPGFVELLPTIVAIYVPLQAPIFELMVMGSTPLLAGIIVVALLLLQRDALRTHFALLFAASIGFSVAFYLQRKGWAYHAYPMLSLALAALISGYIKRWPLTALFQRSDALLRLVSGAFIAVIVVMSFSWFSTARDTSTLVEPIKRAVTNPKILALSDGTDTGFPLTRKVGGEWVGRGYGMWRAAGALVMKVKNPDPKKEPLYESYVEHDRLAVIADLKNQKPDIVIVERIRFDWLAWAKSDPRIARELENYRELIDVNNFVVLRRK